MQADRRPADRARSSELCASWLSPWNKQRAVSGSLGCCVFVEMPLCSAVALTQAPFHVTTAGSQVAWHQGPAAHVLFASWEGAGAKALQEIRLLPCFHQLLRTSAATRGSICLRAHNYGDACSRSQVVSRACRGSCLKQRSRQAQHPFPQGFPVNHLQAASQLSALPAPWLQTCQDVHPVPAKSSKKGRLPPRVPSPANWASERWGISSGRD